MKKSLRSAIALASVLTVGLLTTACQNDDNAASAPSKAATAAAQEKTGDTGSAPAADEGGKAAQGADASGGTKSGSDGGQPDGSTGSGGKDGVQQGSGDKDGYGQVCGTNDLVWKVTAKTQAGGYDEISVRAQSGITCVLPAGIPVVTFGIDGGPLATNAEQSAGRPITLSGNKTAYAGVTPKTTNDDSGTEYASMTVSVEQNDPDPVPLAIDAVQVSEPAVSSWHTDPSKAVPLS
ncbi:DUF4232 domain-containing protein [Streptomyces sp. NPDC047315]|uniref:DUF4232 domain-containing protein n=1 Tax=Streptomyces sp. NPDC047315 TaxID=3155142 RepID=UPI0033C08B8A